MNKTINVNSLICGGDLKELRFNNEHFGLLVNNLSVFTKPFEIPETTGEHDYKTCKQCQNNYNTTKQLLEDLYNGKSGRLAFPFCCEYHKNLPKQPTFKKADFDKVPELTAKKIVLTYNHITNHIKGEDWYKKITDYLECAYFSFGQMPKNCGGALFINYYDTRILDYLKKQPKKHLDTNKKNALIEFVKKQSKVPSKENKDIDLSLLISTYENWLNLFPFEISYFKELKEYYKHNLPILKNEIEVNEYTGLAKAQLHTKHSLFEALIKLTDDFLQKFASVNLFEQGILTNTDEALKELIVNEAKLNIKQGYSSLYADENLKYHSMLKQWYKDQQDFWSKIKPLLNKPTITNNNRPEAPTFESLFICENKAEVISKVIATMQSIGIIDADKKYCLGQNDKSAMVSVYDSLDNAVSKQPRIKKIQLFCEYFGTTISQSTISTATNKYEYTDYKSKFAENYKTNQNEL